MLNNQARSQTMNTVVAAAYSARRYAYLYMRLYTQIMLCYTYLVYIYYVYISVRTPLSGSQNQHFKLYNALRNIAKNILHLTYIFENELIPTTAI